MSPKSPSPQAAAIDLWRRRIGLPLAILATLAVWFLPSPSGLTPVGQRALALFAGIFVLYLTEAIPLPITSLGIVPLAVLMGIAAPRAALESFGSLSVYLLVGAFVLASAMVKSRLAERITLLIMKGVGSSAFGVSIGITLANVCLAFLVPSSTARTAILLPVCLGMVAVFKQGSRSRFGRGLLLTLAFTNATIGAGILTATLPNPVIVEFIAKAGGPNITYAQWLLYGFPPALVMTFVAWWFCRLMFRPEIDFIPGGSDYVKKGLEALGPVSGNEKRALFVFLLVVTLWVTGGWTKMDVTIACLFAILFLFLPGLGFLTWEDANRGVSWQIVFVAGGGIGLGDMMMKTGAAKWLALSILKTLGLTAVSVIVLLIVVMLIIQYLHLLFVGTTAMTAAILPVVLGMAEASHLSPLVLALPAGMIIGGYPLLMFYNTLPNILVYGTGELAVEDFPRVGVLVCTIACGVYAVCALTYWRWLGLL